MLPKAQEAFRGSIDFGSGVGGLIANGKSCCIAITAYGLRLLEHTGMDREGKALSVLRPHNSNGSYGIKLRCDRHRLAGAAFHRTQSRAPHPQR